MVTITLTTRQLKKIREDMGNQVEMLTDGEVNAIAQKVNNEINLPFLSEEKELIVFAKIIKWIDKQLYKLLPNEYYELVQDSSNGISKEEAEKLKERLAPLINEAVDIPVIPEKLEEKLIGLVLGVIIDAMVNGLKLKEVRPA